MKTTILALIACSTFGASLTASAAAFYCETDGIVNNKKAVSECLYLEMPSSLLADKYCLSWGKRLKLKSERDLSDLIMSTAFVKNNSNDPNPRSALEKCETDRARIIDGYDERTDMTKSIEQLGRYETTIYTRKAN